MQMRGMLSTKNYSAGQYDRFESVNGETLAEEHNIVNKGCLTCPIKCARTVDVNGRTVKGPELETMVLLGGGICNEGDPLLVPLQEKTMSRPFFGPGVRKTRLALAQMGNDAGIVGAAMMGMNCFDKKLDGTAC